MGVLIPRVRTLGIRLSEEEYTKLERYCVEHRERSISDVARAAICHFLDLAPRESSPASVAREDAGAQLDKLEQELQQLTAEIAALKTHK